MTKRKATVTTGAPGSAAVPWQRAYAADLMAQGLPAPTAEFRFHPTRLWRFDVAFPRYRVAVEREGGIYQGGGTRCECCRQPIGGAHRAVEGILRDIEKYNAAAARGWLVLRVPPDKLYQAETHQLLRHTLQNRGWTPPRGGTACPTTHR